MNIRNCRKCGKVFNHIGGIPICPACKEAAEKRFQDVKKYVREHPGSDIRQIAADCEVEVQQIQQWIREERLEFTDDSPIKLPCENCGVMIRAGKYCDACKNAMARNLNDAFGMNKPKATMLEPVKKHSDGNKMRYLDKH